MRLKRKKEKSSHGITILRAYTKTPSSRARSIACSTIRYQASSTFPGQPRCMYINLYAYSTPATNIIILCIYTYVFIIIYTTEYIQSAWNQRNKIMSHNNNLLQSIFGIFSKFYNFFLHCYERTYSLHAHAITWSKRIIYYDDVYYIYIING